MMKKRFWGLLLAAAMLVTTLPASALTAHAADPISLVTVQGAVVPFAGESPAWDYTLPNAQHCSLAEVLWYCVTDYEWLTKADTFEAGKVYQLQLLFYPKTGYEFTDWTNLRGKLLNIPESKYTTSVGTEGAARRINFTFRPTAAFTDVADPDDFYEGAFDAVCWAVRKGITTGWDDGTFRPWNTCNRAAIVTFLHRFCGCSPHYSDTAFSDMTGRTDFDNAIRWAVYCDITTGYSDGTFRPWNTCNRLAAVTFLYRLEQSAVG